MVNISKIVERIIKWCIGYHLCYSHCETCLYSDRLGNPATKCTKFNISIDARHGCCYHAMWSFYERSEV
jgi:hypothetical protein